MRAKRTTHPRIWAAISAVCGLLLLAVTAQAGNKPPTCQPPAQGATPTNAVVVLFDTSRSTQSPAIRNAYSTDFKQRVAFAIGTKGGALYGQSSFVVAGAIDHSDATDFHPLQCTYPPADSGTNPLVYAYQVHGYNTQVQQAVGKILHSSRRKPGTTILDALTGVSNLLSGISAKHKYLVLFSDMLEVSPRLKMTRTNMLPQNITRVISTQRQDGDLPHLKGFAVYVAGAGAYSATKRAPTPDEVRQFWIKYFHAAGARLSRANYNGHLLRFP